MPLGFLTDVERARLNRFPEHIPEDDLSAFFLLSEADHHAVNRQREAHTRLGFALQLCALRYLNQSTGDSYTRRHRYVDITRLYGSPSVPMSCGSI